MLPFCRGYARLLQNVVFRLDLQNPEHAPDSAGQGGIQHFAVAARIRGRKEASMEPKRLCRASVDKKICGVCGGIAHYFDVDSNLIRLITAALVLAGGLSVWLYIIAAIILPETDAF